MLSKKGYKILKQINQRKFDEIKDMDTLSHLENCGFVSVSGVGEIYVTPAGQEAYEERYARNRDMIIHFVFTLTAIIISVISLMV